MACERPMLARFHAKPLDGSMRSRKSTKRPFARRITAPPSWFTGRDTTLAAARWPLGLDAREQSRLLGAVDEGSVTD